MEKIASILNLLETKVSQETFNDIIQIAEGLYTKKKRGDLLDDISKFLTGKTLKDHIKCGTQKAVKTVANKAIEKFKNN